MIDPEQELLDVLDERDQAVGFAPRSEVHRLGLRHRSVHVIVLHPQHDTILLQRRALAKRDWPGLWDTSVGGHVGRGEPSLEAALRETFEELGLAVRPEDLLPGPTHHMFEEPLDQEVVDNFRLFHAGPFQPDPAEVAEVRWWTPDEVGQLIRQGLCTPHFALQWREQLGLGPAQRRGST